MPEEAIDPPFISDIEQATAEAEELDPDESEWLINFLIDLAEADDDG